MKLNFEQNFNNKLNCKILTTIRKAHSADLIATDVEIYLQNIKAFIGRVVGQHKLKFKDIPYIILKTDTGLDFPTISQYLELFQKWYSDWTEETEVEILVIKRMQLNDN